MPAFQGTERYDVREHIGSGEWGDVYRVYDRVLGKDVALKCLPKADPDALLVLKEEFRRAGDITHPNVVELHELETHGEHAFFTMELVSGTTVVEAYREHIESAPDEANRLCKQYVAQLVEGVHEVHRHGLLHRDIKPDNVLVTTDGRVVLLDLGLAMSQRPDPLRQRPGLAGTLVYMPPEQVWGRGLSTAADWYAVGAVWYEMLTAQPPFEGAATEVLHEKQRGGPQHPVPSTLDPDQLVQRLMSPSVADRPTYLEIASFLNLGKGAPHASVSGTPSVDQDVFVGRQEELDVLAASLQSKSIRVVNIRGQSGIGKSSLVRKFCETAGAQTLIGRSRPFESVPYKMLDGVIDDLSHLLQKRPDMLDAEIEHLPALLRLFPILGRAAPFDRLEPASLSVDPLTLRRRAVGALSEVLRRASQDVDVVVWLDDAQWGDADSLALLRLLLRSGFPDNALLVVAFREEDVGASALLTELSEDPLSGAPAQRELALRPLSATESSDLVSQLSRGSGLSASEIAQAEGSPYFLRELAHRSVERLATDRSATSLKTVVFDRVQHLSDDSRELVRLASLAARPLSRATLLAAAGLDRDGRTLVDRLERASFLRRTERGQSRNDEVFSPYHDKIREAVVGALSDTEAVSLHGSLVDALEAAADDAPDLLMVHCLGAKRMADAARFAERAGERAEQALAFARAAELYEIASNHHDAEGDRVQATTRRAAALAQTGRGIAAGECYLAAADHHENANSRRSTVQELRRKGAEQLIRGGSLDKGLAVQESVLSAVGVRMPKRAWSALFRAVLRRLRMFIQGSRFGNRAPRDVDEETNLWLDAVWGASTGLSTMNFALADDLGTLHLARTLRVGDRSRVLKALGYEAAFEACIGRAFFCERAKGKLAVVHQLAEQTGDPYDQAWSHMSETAARWSFADWEGTVSSGRKALQGYLEQCPGTVWELGITQVFFLSALLLSGRVVELEERLDQALDDAIERGDLYAANNYRLGQMSVVRLLRGRSEEALSLAEQARTTWPNTLAHSQHYHYANFMVQAHLYRGEVSAALAQAESSWPVLRGMQLHHCEVPAVELSHLHARAAMAVLRDEPAHLGTSRTRLERLVRSTAARLSRHRIPMGRAFGAALAAGLARPRAPEGDFTTLALRAASDFADAGMTLHAEIARFRAEPSEANRACLRERGLVDVNAAADMFFPVL